MKRTNPFWKNMPAAKRQMMFSPQSALNQRIRAQPARVWRSNSSRPSITTEKKTVDAEANFSLNKSTPQLTDLYIQALNVINDGSGYWQRIGNKINLSTLEVDAYLFPKGNNTDNDMWRILVVYDRQTNGALPSITDILQDRDASGAIITEATSRPNSDNRDRFIILRDDKLYVGGGTNSNATSHAAACSTTTAGDTAYLRKMFIPLKNLPSQYKASTLSIGDITSGGLYFIAYSTCYTALTNSATTGWRCEAKFRLRYWDK